MSPVGLLGLYVLLVFALATVMVLISGLLGPKNPTAKKLEPYECGVSSPQTTEARWPVRFALVAMLFLIFDVESLFLYPWAVQVRERGIEGLLAVMGFFVVLGVGYLYARSRGSLQWHR